MGGLQQQKVDPIPLFFESSFRKHQFKSRNEEDDPMDGGNRSSRISRRRNEGKEVVSLRKGPWKEEEDEVLLSHVRRHGPRDWSSIRSNGFLQRTGKSCRLRWVNKLRPNLKNGCKFSAEEERIVIEMQAEFGNKWARIATYLTGRTDNDVKNFWSSRQKRLARILQASSSSSSTASSSRPRKNKRKIPASRRHAPEMMRDIKPQIVEGLSTKSGECPSSFIHGSHDVIKAAPLSAIPQKIDDSNIVQPDFSNDGNSHEEPQPYSSCQDFSNLQSGFPFGLDYPEYFNLIGPEAVNGGQFSVDAAFLQSPGVDQSNTPDLKIDDVMVSRSFLKDLPSCMPDQFEKLPSPSRW